MNKSVNFLKKSYWALNFWTVVYVYNFCLFCLFLLYQLFTRSQSKMVSSCLSGRLLARISSDKGKKSNVWINKTSVSVCTCCGLSCASIMKVLSFPAASCSAGAMSRSNWDTAALHKGWTQIYSDTAEWHIKYSI